MTLMLLLNAEILIVLFATFFGKRVRFLPTLHLLLMFIWSSDYSFIIVFDSNLLFYLFCLDYISSVSLDQPFLSFL